ncbi:MAG TPA: hypothetical protein DDY70_07065 [Clostridiales bacterium]|nr:hypothetical protein [Clostridiales bacterium]
MKERILTCIVCPRGCEIAVDLSEDGSVTGVRGNACPRGSAYAERECTHPERTVTTTVRCADGGVASVRTRTPVPRDAVFAVMAAVADVTAPATLSVGDIVIADVAGTGVDLIATENRRPTK